MHIPIPHTYMHGIGGGHGEWDGNLLQRSRAQSAFVTRNHQQKELPAGEYRVTAGTYIHIHIHTSIVFNFRNTLRIVHTFIMKHWVLIFINT